MKCPNCGLENPKNAQWCDCGYDFSKKTLNNELRNKEYENKPPSWHLFLGWLLAFTFGIFGFAVGLTIYLNKEYDEKSKKIGLSIMLVGLLVCLLTFIISSTKLS